MADDVAPGGEDAPRLAREYLRRYEESGYGTTRSDRYSPMVLPETVKALAEAVLEQTGSTDPT